MPGPIFNMKKDPNSLGRGPGFYYHRGHGYFSFYNVERDKKIKARGFKIDPVGRVLGTNKYSMKRQAHDGYLNSKLWN